jgi:hypothetical protein
MAEERRTRTSAIHSVGPNTQLRSMAFSKDDGSCIGQQQQFLFTPRHPVPGAKSQTAGCGSNLIHLSLEHGNLYQERDRRLQVCLAKTFREGLVNHVASGFSFSYLGFPLALNTATCPRSEVADCRLAYWRALGCSSLEIENKTNAPEKGSGQKTQRALGSA